MTNVIRKIKKHATAVAVAIIATCSFGAGIDITDAVRETGKGKTSLEKGACYDGHDEQNAFGKADDGDSRVMMTTVENAFIYEITEDFRPNESIIVTEYTIRRAYATGSADTYSQERAPSTFQLQGFDGDKWWVLDEQTGIVWSTPRDKTFVIDSAKVKSCRKYRFLVTATNHRDGDSVVCSFQYVALKGFILDGAQCLDEGIAKDGFATILDDVKLSLDSKIEFDISFNSIAGTQGLFSNCYSNEEKKYRLLHTDSGWRLDYGTETYTSSIKATPNARYTIVVDGPLLSVNGHEVINAGVKLTDLGTKGLSLLATYSTSDSLYNPANVTIHGVKVYNAAGELQLALRPGVAIDSRRALVADPYGFRAYTCRRVNGQVPNDFSIVNDEVNIVAKMREEGASPEISVKPGTVMQGSSKENLFTTDLTTAARLLTVEPQNTVAFTIPDGYEEGCPVVLTRFVITPCVGTSDSALDVAAQRAPAQFEFQASKDGESWTTLYAQAEKLSAADYKRGAKLQFDNVFGYAGISFEIPESKRGDYRHYRLVTTDTNRPDADTSSRWAVQELRIYGTVGSPELRYDPIAYVQNAKEEQAQNNTYFKTGVRPTKVDITIELTGSFTDVKETSCLFCSRDSDSKNTWTLFCINGKLRLDYNTTGQESGFAPVTNKDYKITVKEKELWVDDVKVYTSTAGDDFTPGSQIVLMASHRAATGSWSNQARFKLKSCKIIDACGGLMRDYVPVKDREDGKGYLYDKVTGTVCSDGVTPRMGDEADVDFCHHGRAITLMTGLVDGRLPNGDLVFALNGNQVLQGTLCAAFDTSFVGNDIDNWKQIVELGTVKGGEATMAVRIPRGYAGNPCVKFFIRDAFGVGTSYTRSYTRRQYGLIIVVE